MLRSHQRSGVALLAVLVSCAAPGDDTGLPTLPDGAQAISLLGDTLYPLSLPDSVAQDRELKLAQAQAAFDKAPEDPDSIIWLGRRLGYMTRYRDAIATFTEGLAVHPQDARFYRHRGHRYISVREFDRAIIDFLEATRLVAGQADEIEPDGLPNPRGIPLSTLQFNIWYHLGLVHYLRGNFERAASAYRECMTVSGNPDTQVATGYWLYMTLRRLGRDEEAAAVLQPVSTDMEIIENSSYHRLLLLNKGEITPEDLLGTEDAADPLQNATLGYGIGNWHFYNGRHEEAMAVWQRVLQGTQWAAFGYIATEAEVFRKGG